MTKVRILHLFSSFNLGGQETRAVRLMNHFGDRAKHSILSAMPDRMEARDAIDRKIEVEFPGDSAPALHGRPGMGRYRKLGQYMKRFHLVLSYNWGAMDGVMARTLLGASMGLPPLIHHEDGFNEDEIEKLNWKRNWFRIIALQRAAGIVVPSLTLEKIARQVWHQPAEQIYRFPNGVDVDRYHKKVQRGSFPGWTKREGEVVVGTVAGLRAVKNLPLLVRAVAAAGPNIRLAIAGEGPERTAIMAEAERLKIADRVMLPGFLKDPARFMALFDIFALSSNSEQFPISLIEAMAAARPVVATNVGDIGNMISRENRRFLVPRDDEAALADAIRTLAGDEQLRRDLGQTNYARAIADYSETEMLARYQQLYGATMRRADFARQD
ncbi:MAG: glycosyltransferase family 4 protein [Sphingorhabdus sp.]